MEKNKENFVPLDHKISQNDRQQDQPKNSNSYYYDLKTNESLEKSWRHQLQEYKIKEAGDPGFPKVHQKWKTLAKPKAPVGADRSQLLKEWMRMCFTGPALQHFDNILTMKPAFDAEETWSLMEDQYWNPVHQEDARDQWASLKIKPRETGKVFADLLKVYTYAQGYYVSEESKKKKILHVFPNDKADIGLLSTATSFYEAIVYMGYKWDIATSRKLIPQRLLLTEEEQREKQSTQSMNPQALEKVVPIQEKLPSYRDMANKKTQEPVCQVK